MSSRIRCTEVRCIMYGGALHGPEGFGHRASTSQPSSENLIWHFRIRPQAKGITFKSELSRIRQTREAGDSFCRCDSADGWTELNGGPLIGHELRCFLCSRTTRIKIRPAE